MQTKSLLSITVFHSFRSMFIRFPIFPSFVCCFYIHSLQWQIFLRCCWFFHYLSHQSYQSFICSLTKMTFIRLGIHKPSSLWIMMSSLFNFQIKFIVWILSCSDRLGDGLKNVFSYDLQKIKKIGVKAHKSMVVSGDESLQQISIHSFIHIEMKGAL